eukprot:5561627-Karenia_brevis.AAC.1
MAWGRGGGRNWPQTGRWRNWGNNYNNNQHKQHNNPQKKWGNKQSKQHSIQIPNTTFTHPMGMFTLWPHTRQHAKEAVQATELSRNQPQHCAA